jgi:hypothetical protein
VNEYHAVMDAIVVIKMMLDIVRNIHTLMSEYLVVMDAIVVIKMMLDIVQNILIQTDNYQKFSSSEHLISITEHERIFVIRISK